MDSHRREYEGVFFKEGDIYFEERPSWILDENNVIEKIQIGDLIFEKKTDEEISPNKGDFNPNINSVDIFKQPQFGMSWGIDEY